MTEESQSLLFRIMAEMDRMGWASPDTIHLSTRPDREKLAVTLHDPVERLRYNQEIIQNLLDEVSDLAGSRGGVTFYGRLDALVRRLQFPGQRLRERVQEFLLRSAPATRQWGDWAIKHLVGHNALQTYLDKPLREYLETKDA